LTSGTIDATTNLTPTAAIVGVRVSWLGFATPGSLGFPHFHTLISTRTWI